MRALARIAWWGLALPVLGLAVPAVPRVLTPPEGGVVHLARPPVAGTADPGAVVSFRVDGSTAGAVTADGVGAWSGTPSFPLLAGPHQVDAWANDPGGSSGLSGARLFTVVDVPPEAPVVLLPAAGSQLDPPAVVYAGSAEPGTTVRLSLDGAVQGDATVTPGGLWSLAPPAAPLRGPHVLTAQDFLPDGGSSVAGEPVAFSVTGTSYYDFGCSAAPAGALAPGLVLLALGARVRRGASSTLRTPRPRPGATG